MNKGKGDKRRWAAPKLGCYVLCSEELENRQKWKFVLGNIRTLTDIKISEPDPNYFDVSLPEGYKQVTPEEWVDAYVNRVKALRAQQPL